MRVGEDWPADLQLIWICYGPGPNMFAIVMNQ